MNTHRIAARRRREVYKKKCFLGFSTAMLILALSIILGSNFADAHGNAQEAPVTHKYYKSIEIVSGDTLWDIANEYKQQGSSVTDYIHDLKEINKLNSDDICSSQYLTVVYYDTQFL